MFTFGFSDDKRIGRTGSSEYHLQDEPKNVLELVGERGEPQWERVKIYVFGHRGVAWC